MSGSKTSPRSSASEKQFAVWRANGEALTAYGESVHHVAKKHRIAPEPGAEVVAIIEISHLIRPDGTGPAVLFTASRNRNS